MSRRRANGRRSRSAFNKRARRTHKKNTTLRGGRRL